MALDDHGVGSTKNGRADHTGTWGRPCVMYRRHSLLLGCLYSRLRGDPATHKVDTFRRPASNKTSHHNWLPYRATQPDFSGLSDKRHLSERTPCSRLTRSELPISGVCDRQRQSSGARRSRFLQQHRGHPKATCSVLTIALTSPSVMIVGDAEGPSCA